MVMAVVTESRKSAKRARRSGRVSADLPDFFAFPLAAEKSSAFRDAVRTFVSGHARFTFPPSSLFSSLVTWEILLRVGDLTDGPDLSPVIVSLDVVEEDVTRTSRSVYCDHCRVVGWSGHPVCRKRYHFIIRSENSGDNVNGFQKSCSRCGNNVSLSDSSCKWCGFAASSDDVENWVYAQFDDPSHLLHGVVHGNGYGHLLTVNGREGGSKFLSGRSIVDFWDRLCRRLAVRMVTVMDMSRKHGLDYRLLHAVAEGHSWYGNWGYELKSGSYALTKDAYRNALDTLSSMALEPFLYERRKPRSRLQNTIAFYQSMAESKLVTLRDLFSYLLKLIHQTHESSILKETKKPRSCATSESHHWAIDDVECVQEAMVKVLKVAGGKEGWVRRRALRGVKRKAASQELLNYCLEHLEGRKSCGMKVQSRYNPTNNDFEFRLQPNAVASLDANYPSTEQIIEDLKYLGKSLLHPETMVKYGSQETVERAAEAARKILDCKQFVKHYKLDVDNPFALNLWCHLELSDSSRESPIPPPELLILPASATIMDLKIEAAKAFQDVYAMFKRLEVEKLLEYGYVDESLTLKFLFGNGGLLKIRGRCFSKHGLLRYRMERGTEHWKVDCLCGAKDDDGERMLACDDCGVWQHTRCLGIQNSDALPSQFLCSECAANPNSHDKITSNPKDSYNLKLLTGLTCRGEAVSIPDRRTSSGLSATIRGGLLI